MCADVIENYIPCCINVMWSNFDSNPKENHLSILTVNAHSLTGKFADLVTNLNLLRKRFFFIIVTDLWLSYYSDLVLEINGYKSHSISRKGRKGGGIKLFYLDYISTEATSHISVKGDSYERFFVKTSIPGLGNMYVAEIYQPPNKPVTDFTQFISGAMRYTNRFHTVFAGDLKIDFMNISNVTRIYINTFHPFSFVNEINLPTFILPSNGNVISSIDHVWYNLKVPRSSYVVSIPCPI